jgi:hypothetical protein
MIVGGQWKKREEVKVGGLWRAAIYLATTGKQGDGRQTDL